MPAVTRYLLLLALLSHLTTDAQIRVEMLSRTDSFAFLGSGSDNRVRIHNLPVNAVVTISPGAAVHVKDDEYVLCRFGECIKKGAYATLKVIVDNKIAFEKKYKLSQTKISGSTYNPILQVALGHQRANTGNVASKYDTMSLDEFNAVLNNNEFVIRSDTSIKVDGFIIAAIHIVGNTGNYIGPFNVGPHFEIRCGTFDDWPNSPKRPSNKEIFKMGLEEVAHLLTEVKPNDRIFINCITATGREGGIYSVTPKIIYIR